MSVPESVCVVDDEKSNFSKSCNNDNYDSNQSKKGQNFAHNN